MNRCLRVAAALSLAIALVAAPACAPSPPADHGEIIRVPQDAATLADAAERIGPGGTIVIAPGVYAEQVLIDTPDVTVRGEDRNETVIDGGGSPTESSAISRGVRVENLTVTGATFYGVLFTGLHDKNGSHRADSERLHPLDPTSSRRCSASSSTM